ncbi:tetratricopeptide repeat protein, partial [bacterium]|nr:tetratricopeptide repeat protein [candidate division CSSED10-310 bacterium]
EKAEKLVLIRESFRDGLLDYARGEAEDFLRKYQDTRESSEVSLILGIIEKKMQHQSKALQRFQTAYTSQDPHIKGQAAYEIAGLHYERGEFLKAAEWFNNATVSADNTGIKITAIKWAGISYAMAGEWSEAIRNLEIFNEYDQDDDDDLAHYYLGLSYFESGESEKGFAACSRVFLRGSDDMKYKSAMAAAQFAFRHGSNEQADLWASRAANVKENPETWIIRGKVAFQQNRWLSAYTCLNQAEQSGSINEAKTLGIKLLSAKSLSRYLSSQNLIWWDPLIDLLEQYPIDHVMTNILNEIATSPPLPQDIAEYIAEGYSWNPVEHGELISRIYFKARLSERAFYWLTLGISSADKGPIGETNRIFMIQLLDEMGETNSAINELHNFVKLQNENRNDYDLMEANLSFKAGNYENAAAKYQEWLINQTDSSENGKVLFWLGECYFRMDNWKLAVSAFKSSTDRLKIADPLHELSSRRLISGYFNVMQWQNVIDASEKYIAEYNDSMYKGEVYYFESLALANLGMFDEALVAAGKALDNVSDPEFLDVIKGTIRRIESNRMEVASLEDNPAQQIDLGNESTHESVLPELMGFDDEKP